jgi:hypothetical protein
MIYTATIAACGLQVLGGWMKPELAFRYQRRGEARLVAQNRLGNWCVEGFLGSNHTCKICAAP